MSDRRKSKEELSANALIAGRFRLEGSLGKGGMADVYRAIDIATNTPIALKLLRSDMEENAEAVARVRREGEVLRTLAHPAIVRIETFGMTEDGRLFIAMELLEGETLGHRMRRDGKLAPADLAPIVAGTCAGLSAAHGKGIIHRDLKPDNVFLVRLDGGGEQVKLLDFGIAKVANEKKLTQTGEVVGTPRYMAPEQLAAERDLDGRTDIYALGIILFEALAGKPPFLSTNPTDLIVSILHGKHAPLRSYRPDVRAEVEAVVARAMARSREGRYGTAVELGEAFVSAALGDAPSGKNAGPRTGMETAFMGSLADGESDVAGEDKVLRPGTFSELAETPAPVVVAAGARSAPTEAAVSVGSAPLAPAATTPAKPIGAPTVPARISAMPSTPSTNAWSSEPNVDRMPERRGHAQAAHPASDAGRMSTPNAANAANVAMMPAVTRQPSSSSATDDYRLPTSGGRTKLVVLGVLAGAVSAGLAIFGLSLAMRGGDDEPSADTTTVTADNAVALPPSVGVVVAGSDAGHATPDAGVLLEVPTTAAEGEPARGADVAENVEPTTESTGSARRSSGSSSMTRGSISRMTGASEPGLQTPDMTGVNAAGGGGGGERAPTAHELVEQARAALRSGDARRCVELCDGALRAGAAPDAQRLRGDCLLGVGDRPRALDAYERFCRAAPTHGSIEEVRAIVRGMGGTCD